MKYRTLNNGEQIPVLGFGTWRLGGNMSPDYSRDKECVALIQSAVEAGYTHIDTAEMYAGGHTEELIGRAIQRFNRQDIFLTTKIWHTHLEQQAAIAALENSLKRLHTDYIDACLVHWPSNSTPLEDTFAGLNQLVEQGKVRYLGVSNFDLPSLKRAQEFAATPLITNQVPYNLYNRTYVKNGVYDYCQEQGILLTAYSPFDRGSLLQNPRLVEIAARYGATTAQIALSWLVSQEGVITIPMSTSHEHLNNNLQALEIELEESDCTILDQLELPEESLWPE